MAKSAVEIDDTVRTNAKALPGRLFNHQPGEFSEHFNRFPFMISHNLANHALFELSQLMELAQVLWSKTGKVVFFTDSPSLDQGWNRSTHRSTSLVRAFSHLGETNSWILLKSIQEVPEYKALLTQCLAELEQLCNAPLSREITWADAYVFIASPHTMTPYHIDHESNFLLQIHGEKEIHLFDPHDQTILTDPEIEQYYAGDLSAARYRDELEKCATVFKITPGRGVHHPVRAPHWVRNGDTYSVALSVLFFMREYDMQAKVYQANHFLRKLKMTPTPPGQSAMKDRVKMFLLGDMGHKSTTKSDVIRYGLKKYKAPVRFGQWMARPFTRRKTSTQ